MQFPGVALVTGAGSGIGRATAHLFARDGCKRIVITDINRAGIDAVKKSIESTYEGTKVVAVQCDITSEPEVKTLIATAVENFSRIDYACNVAGIVLITGASNDCTSNDFDKTISINLRGAWLCQKYEIQQMLKQDPIGAPDSHFKARGAIVNVASMAALRPYLDLPAYCASKSGVMGITRSDGLKYAKDLIRVNAVCPGVIRTEMLEEFEGGHTGDGVQGMVTEMAVGRIGAPEEVAEAITWLSCHRASLITGGYLAPNGGMLAG